MSVVVVVSGGEKAAGAAVAARAVRGALWAWGVPLAGVVLAADGPLGAAVSAAQHRLGPVWFPLCGFIEVRAADCAWADVDGQ